MAMKIHVGTAGWQLPKPLRDRSVHTGTLLERYASRFNAVEINSTFYRLPRATTAARWAASVPEAFRFSLKLPKHITHKLQLQGAAKPLAAFAAIVDAMGDRAGPVLVQLPPKLAFSTTGEDFLHLMHEQGFPGIVLEPRHPSWFTAEVTASLKRLHIGRVAADPPRAPGDGVPAGDPRIAYFRLHGRPRIYWSNYEAQELARVARSVGQHRTRGSEVWVIFDNTAQGCATANALDLMDLLDQGASAG